MELINGRTAEEIKAAIKECENRRCDDCPYKDVIECGDAIQTDALKCIEQLEAQVPRWISVEERLPKSEDEKSDCYLVTDGDFIWMAYYACKEWQFAQCTDSPYVIDWTDITHWMPLPEPPKEGAHDAEKSV